MYIVKCIFYCHSELSTLYILHCPLYIPTMEYTVSILHCILYSRVYSIQCTVYIVLYTVYSIHSTVYPAQSQYTESGLSPPPVASSLVCRFDGAGTLEWRVVQASEVMCSEVHNITVQCSAGSVLQCSAVQCSAV